MPQTRDNGTVVPVNSDPYNPTDDLADMADSLFVITPVSSDAQRDALLKFVGRTVRRLDKSGSLEFWDGTQWIPNLISTIWTAGPTTIGTAGGFPGALTLDTNNSQNPSFITSPAVGKLQVQLAGVYAISMHCSLTGGPSGYLAIKNGPATGTYQLVNFPAGGEQSVNIPNLYLAAGAQVSFVIAPSASSSVASTIRMTKIA